jgi:hypothetical protein
LGREKKSNYILARPFAPAFPLLGASRELPSPNSPAELCCCEELAEKIIIFSVNTRERLADLKDKDIFLLNLICDWGRSQLINLLN